MNRLTNAQRMQFIEFCYQNPCSVKKVHRALLQFYGQCNRPTESAIRAIVTKLRTKFTLLDIKPRLRLNHDIKPATTNALTRTEEYITAVLARVNDDYQLLI